MADTAPRPRLFPSEDKVAVDKAEAGAQGRRWGAEGSGNFAPVGGRVPVGSTDWRCCRPNTSPSSHVLAAGLSSSAVAPVHSSKAVGWPPGPLGGSVARSMEEPDQARWCTASVPALRDW